MSSDTEWAFYHTKRLISYEAHALEEIEALLQCEIQLGKPIQAGDSGYLEEKGHVVELYIGNPKGEKWSYIPLAVCALRRLRWFRMNFHLINDVPPEFGELTELTHIDLSCNRFNAVPLPLSRLLKLEVLDLRGNYLTELPEWLGNLPHLRELFLFGNHLKVLPSTLLERVDILTINKLPLKNALFPLEREEFSALIEIVLNCTDFDPQFFQVENTHITELLLSNKIRHVPACIGAFSHLRVLDLSNNYLTELPPTIGNLTELIVLRLNDNMLKELPLTCCRLKNLKSLLLNKNQLKLLPEYIGNFVHLTYLQCLDNEITQLPESIASLPWLQMLNEEYLRQEFNRAPLTIKKKLIQLFLYRVNFDFISHDDENIIALRIFAPFEGTVEERMFDLITSFNGLEDLNLSNINLTEIPHQICRILTLKQLNLSGNQIMAIPVSISRMSQLEYLNLADNLITEIPDALCQLTNLRCLVLYKNKLQYLPVSFHMLSNIEEIFLSNNPWMPFFTEYIFPRLPDGNISLDHTGWLMICDRLQHLDNLVNILIEKIKENLPLEPIESHFPWFAKYAHILQSICEQYPTDTAKEVFRILKNAGFLKGNQFGIWL